MFHKILLKSEEAASFGTSVVQNGAGLSTFSSQRAQPQALQTRSHPFIVVIDDSVTVCKILETCLSREGFQVKSFPDGIEAVRWLTEPQACIPDLLWLDIGLPKIDGYGVARYIKSKPRFNNTVIVMLSRHDSVIDRLKGRLVGAKDYLTKPFKTEDIVHLTQSYLGLISSWQEAPHSSGIVQR